ncbi:MAG TPA: hypothetical protein DHW39_06050 [Erysipelotrichaceae bacterium]|nr:hypothetical protein [Erysipelotrichaceae bacterium]
MNEKNNAKGGIRIGKNDSAYEAIMDAMPHWIHKTKEDASSLTGFLYLPQCSCSVCGFEVSFERERCPHCGVKMTRR